MRLLFICTANQNRSRTAEDILRRDFRHEVRSAGTDVYDQDPEERPVTSDLVDWADLIFVMEQYHLGVLSERFPGCERKTVVLDIPDIYQRGDPHLSNLLQERLRPHLT